MEGDLVKLKITQGAEQKTTASSTIPNAASKAKPQQ
jgi:hypothetical protein